MEFTIIEDGERVKYTREGRCNFCGECCCKNVINVNITAGAGNEKTDGGETDWNDWNGYSEFRSQVVWWWMKFNVHDEMREEPCCKLVDGRCSIWKTDEFPAVCRYFPVHPRDIERFENCGFSFRRVVNEEEETN